MLVTFRSKVGDITMFGEVAVNMLKLMGQSGGVPGAVLAADLPAALDSLKRGLSARAQEEAPAGRAAPSSKSGDDRDTEPPIALSTRAKPLLDLLDRAARSSVDVTWSA